MKIVQLEKQRDALPGQAKSAEKAYGVFKRLFDKKSDEISELEKSLKQIEAALELNNDRIERTKKKMEGVQNTREYAAATKEIEQVEKTQSGSGRKEDRC